MADQQNKAAKKEAKRLRLRSRHLTELVETEVQYVRDLEILTEVYIDPLKSNNIINGEQHRLLFKNIPALIKLNTEFRDALSNRYNNNWDPATSKIAPEILQYAPFFHMYQDYLNSHEQAAGLVSKLYIRSSKFKKFVDSAQFNPKCNGLDLSSYLVKPLQRITKYTLLLRELIKHTLSDHPDYAHLRTAMAKINEVNVTINEKMKTFDQRQKVRDIQARFTQNVDLVSPARYFIKEGNLSKICRKKDVKYVFVLFSDLLIYGEKAGDSVKDYQIKIHQQIPINQSFRIRDIPQNIKYGAKCWEIHSPEKSFIVYAEHPGAKYEWYRELEKVVALRSTIESGRQRPAALWVPDDFTTHCMMTKCDHKFNVINRRHHCRYCGRLVCGPCSTNKLPHWTKQNKTVRVCIMCFEENKELQQYRERMKERNGTEDAEKLIQGILEDEDSIEVGSDEDFADWDSSEVEDETTVTDVSHTHTVSEEYKEETAVNGHTEVKDESETTVSDKYRRSLKRKSKKMKLTKKQMKSIHARSASLGFEKDLEDRHTANRGIFSNSAKIFRLCYSHTPKKSTRTLYELANLTVLPNGSLGKRDSESLSSDLNKTCLISPATSYANSGESKNGHSSVLDTHETDDTKTTFDTYTKKRESHNINGLSVGVSNLSLVSNISIGSISASPRNSGSSNRRLKLIGTGTLNIEAHQYDHELVSMRLHTFTEVIDWNLDPHNMKPKKKDDFSCYLKALNVLTQQNEILLVRIKNKDIMDSLTTILMSLSYYYEAENANRDDDDIDSDIEDDSTLALSKDDSVHTVSLSKDTTLEEHKAEIDRAVFLIENSKKHNNIKTLDVAKFLLAKSCPISVIQHAFGKCGVIMPEEVYELAGVPNPKRSKKRKMRDKEKAMMKRHTTFNKSGQRAAKASKLLGTGFNKERMQRKARSNSGDFGDRKKYKQKYGKKLKKIELKQSTSLEAKSEFNDETDFWLPKSVRLPDADNDLRYQKALCNHDIRFHVHKYNSNNEVYLPTLPSDKLDSHLRIVINALSGYSRNKTNPSSPFDASMDVSLSHLATKALATKAREGKKRKSKFGNFFTKKSTDT